MPQEQKEKIRLGNLGKFVSKETIEKMKIAAVKRNPAQWLLGKKKGPMPEETKKKISKNRKGKASGVNNYLWIKDRSLLKDDHRDRGGPLHREWSHSVKKRDGYKCKINNQDCKGRLEAHHILGWTEYPELRYDINNGITLCHAHHPRKREQEAKLSPFFQRLVAEMK